MLDMTDHPLQRTSATVNGESLTRQAGVPKNDDFTHVWLPVKCPPCPVGLTIDTPYILGE